MSICATRRGDKDGRDEHRDWRGSEEQERRHRERLGTAVPALPRNPNPRLWTGTPKDTESRTNDQPDEHDRRRLTDNRPAVCHPLAPRARMER